MMTKKAPRWFSNIQKVRVWFERIMQLEDIQTYRYTYIAYRFEYLNYTIAGAPGDDDEKGAAVVFKYSKGTCVV
jgi:hypothetical protein